MLNLRRILILLLGIAALSFYYIYAEFHGKLKIQEKVESKRLLTLADNEDIVEIALDKTGGEKILLKKQDGHWWIETPRHYPAEEFMAEGLRTAFTTTTWERSFPREASDLGEMGLDVPIQKIGLTLSSNAKRTLLLGKPAPTGHFVYAMWEEGKDIYLLHDQFARSFDKTTYSLRKKRIFDLSNEDVYAVDIALEKKNLTLVKFKGEWQAVAKESFSVDPAQVETLLSGLLGMYVKEFLDDLNPLNPDLELDAKKYHISVTHQDGITTTLWVGAKNQEKDAYFGLREGENAVFLLGGEKIHEVPPTADYLRPQQVKQVEVGKIQKVKLKKLGTEVELIRIDEQWRFETEESTAPDKLNESVEDLVTYVQEVNYLQPLDPSKKPQVPYAITVKLLSEGQQTQEYTFYKRGSEIIAESSNQTGIFQVDEKVWIDLDQYFREVVGYRKL